MTGDATQPLRVVAGLLIASDGKVFVQQRTGPPSIAGLWEFPGGKIESGETPHAALVRELQEEIGIQADDIVPWMRVRHRYPERVVILDVMHVRKWTGTVCGLEQQPVDWTTPDALRDWSMLGANPVIVDALIREAGLDGHHAAAKSK